MQLRSCLTVFAVSLVILLTGCAEESNEPPGTVIVNARVIDGTGGPVQDVNVRFVADRITAIGEFEPIDGDTVIDAAGKVLAPGFIDVHSHHEWQLDAHPDALAAVSQGVTTIAAGQDGSQVAPLAEFFAELEASPVSINVASFAGHGTIRDWVMGEDYMRHATTDELALMSEMLERELEAGALGLSSGLEYDPGSFSNTEELVELAKVASRHGGRYISHIRSEDQYFWEGIDEVVRIGREAELPVQVTHIKLAMARWWGQADKLKDTLDAARASGVDITADIYPYGAWNTGFSWLQTLFPDRDLTRRDGAKYVLEEMLSPEGILLPEFEPNPEYNGMTIADVAALHETDPESTLMELLQADVAMGGNSPMIGFAMAEPDIELVMAWPHTVIGSDGELAGPHPRGYGAFTRYLGHYVRDRGVLSLEEGVRRLTLQSAEQVGIAGRGAIEVGYHADLVIFDPDTIVDKATYTEPHIPSVGITTVWVNGQVVFEGGTTTDLRPGVVVRRADGGT